MKDFVFVWLVDEDSAIVLLFAQDCQLWRVLPVVTDDGEPLDSGNTFDIPLLSTPRFADAWATAAEQGGGHDEPDVYEAEGVCNPGSLLTCLN